MLRIKPSGANAATDCFSRFATDDLVLVATIPTDLPWLKDVGATGSNTLTLAGIVDCLPSAADRRQLHLLVSLRSDWVAEVCLGQEEEEERDSGDRDRPSVTIMP